jgi:hypothetical protein
MSLSIPANPFLAFPIISTMTDLSVGRNIARFVATAAAVTAWGTINQARYVPFWIPEPITVVKLLACNGSTTAGNTDIGLYDSAGNEIVGIAAAAQSGSSGVWQAFDIADTPILPGLYFIGLLNTTTTGTYIAWADKEAGRAAGVYSQAVGAGTLPSPTATFAALDAAVIPVVGMATRTLI